MVRAGMKRIIYIPFDHLHRNFGALKSADPAHDVIALVESARMTTGRNWHKERLFFLISSARHFAQSLEAEGSTVEYIKAATTIDGLKVTAEQLSERLKEYQGDDMIEITLFHQDELRTLGVQLGQPRPSGYELVEIQSPSQGQKQNLQGWIY